MRILPNLLSLTLAKEHFFVYQKKWCYRDKIISGFSNGKISRHNFEHTNINMDWTRIINHDNEAGLERIDSFEIVLSQHI